MKSIKSRTILIFQHETNSVKMCVSYPKSKRHGNYEGILPNMAGSKVVLT